MKPVNNSLVKTDPIQVLEQVFPPVSVLLDLLSALVGSL